MVPLANASTAVRKLAPSALLRFLGPDTASPARNSLRSLERNHQNKRAGLLHTAVYGNRSAMNQLRIVTAQEQNDSGYFLRLRPLCKISAGHGCSIRRRVDDAWQNRIRAHTCTPEILRQ